MESRPKIAVIDDDVGIRETLSHLLSENGFEPASFEGGADFLDYFGSTDLSLAVIDLKLRGESGLMLAQQIRQLHDLPIVMLTGVGDEIDKIIGLETGADDYVMKPFNPRELVARIRAVLRRYDQTRLPEPILHTGTVETVSFGGFTLDLENCELTRQSGEAISLTNAEYRMLEFFVQNPNRIIARPELLEALGSDLNRFLDRTIDVLILRLRRKIERVPSKPRYLQTRRGAGYIFVTKLDADG
jgi:DNA-binding response OmpR family regulator